MMVATLKKKDLYENSPQNSSSSFEYSELKYKTVGIFT